MPPRKKSRLRIDKNRYAPFHRNRAQLNECCRQVHNAALKYGCTRSALTNCKVVIPRLILPLMGRKCMELNCNSIPSVLVKPRILSLFDGISSGMVALKSVGLIPDIYYSSEVDKDCLKVQRFNHHGEVQQLGSICDLSFEILRGLGPIDIIFGSSPCNDLSLCNPHRKGIDGVDGTGILFYEFVRVFQYFKYLAILQNRTENFFWLFENTFSMETKTKDKISKYLGCQPLKICSSSFVPMKRARLFWTNIQIPQEGLDGLQASHVSYTKRHNTLQDFLLGHGRKANIEILPTFTSNKSNVIKGGKFPVVDVHEGDSHMHLSEIESLFGFPQFYTAGPDTPLHVRRRLLAKCWDIHTIQFLLKYLCRHFIVKAV